MLAKFRREAAYREKARMVQAEAESSPRVGSVKEASNFFAQKLLAENTSKQKPQSNICKNAPAKFRDLHQTRNNILRSEDDIKNLAESVKTDVKHQSPEAIRTVKGLSLQIEASNKKANADRQELQRPRKSNNFELPLAVNYYSDVKYLEVVEELEQVKRDLLKLKLGMASVLESKQQAERQISSSVSRARSYSNSLESLRKEIEGTTREQIFLELATMEASRETRAIEVEKESKAATVSSNLEEARKRMEVLTDELNQAKDLEKKLEITNSDISVLEEELIFVKAMCHITELSPSNNSIRIIDLSEEIKKRKEEESSTIAELESALSELNVAKRELQRIEHEGFKFMASMDVIREELNHVSKRTSNLRKMESRYNSTLHTLNSKILRGKYKLETAVAAEKRANSILLNLTATLKQLETEREAASKEKDIITKKTSGINQEIQQVGSRIEQEEGKLQAAMHELDNAKRSEAMALEYLKALTEKTMSSRAPTSSNKPTITLSNFEYALLTRRAKAAEAIADKKVAAAQAWIEALRAGEKEVLMKTQMAQRKIREIKEAEEQEQCQIENALSAKNMAEDELSKRQEDAREEEDDLRISLATKEVVMTTPRRSKYRRSPSPGIRLEGQSNRKTIKVMPSLAKFLGRNKSVKRS